MIIPAHPGPPILFSTVSWVGKYILMLLRTSATSALSFVNDSPHAARWMRDRKLSLMAPREEAA